VLTNVKFLSSGPHILLHLCSVLILFSPLLIHLSKRFFSLQVCRLKFVCLSSQNDDWRVNCRKRCSQVGTYNDWDGAELLCYSGRNYLYLGKGVSDGHEVPVTMLTRNRPLTGIICKDSARTAQ
jgi:hypothetical protein